MDDVLELGLDTFGDVTLADDGTTKPQPQVIRDVVEEGVLADAVGVDFLGIGEHHRADFAVTTPDVVLAAIAARTERIRLGSAVTVLSSDDPIRVFQRFATLDAVSDGRAEVILGRGSFIESFPLFGHDLEDYDALFAEKLDLLLRLRESEHVTWSGHRRAPLDGMGVYPRPLQDPLPLWIAVGGNPSSAVRAGMLGLPMALAIIGGMPERFAPFAEIHRRAAAESGHDAPRLSINSHGLIADTWKEAVEGSWPQFDAMFTKIGRERGWPPTSHADFEASTTLRGANVVGSPEQVIEKILFQHEIFGHDRFLLYMSSVDHAKTMRSIELYGTEVAPAVRAEVARRAAPATADR